MAVAIDDLATAASEATGTSLTATVPAGGVASGARVVVCFAMTGEGGTVSCADGRGNPYSVDEEVTNNTTVRTVVLSAPVATALQPGDAITVTHPEVARRCMTALVLTGLVDGGDPDQTQSAEFTSEAPSAGSLTVSTAPAALVTAVSVGTGGILPFFTPGNGWSAGDADQATVVAIYAQHRVAATAGTYTGEGTLSDTADWAAVFVSYQNVEDPEPEPAVPAGYPWPIHRRRRGWQ